MPGMSETPASSASNAPETQSALSASALARVRPELRAIVNRAFETDKAGNLNTNAVLALRRLDIQDARWVRAMQAIGESLQVVGSKSYIRLYERVGDSDKYQLISLDVAS